ncbi:MAG TPA: FtsX-like permease family protein [Ilumatobacter sp.]|nr:FtsX-like permease family protein [Ilumatobacter sp.]
MIHVSLRDLQWRRRRYVIVVLVASLAFGLALLMSGVAHRLTQEGDDMLALFGADRWVVPESVGGPFSTTQLLPTGELDSLTAQSGVTAASPILIGRTMIDGIGTNVIGYDSASPMLPAKLADARASMADPDAPIVDELFEHGLGDVFELNGHRLRVGAEVSDTAFYFSMPTVWLPLPTVQDYLFAGQDVATAIVVQGSLSPATGDSPVLDVLTNADAQADYDRVLGATSDTLGIINTLLWLMATGVVAAIVYVSVLERSRDFATLKAVGVSNRSLVGGLLTQSAALSLASAVAAVGVAKALSPSFGFPVTMPTAAYVQLLVVALVVGVLASLVGVRKITHIDPALAFGGAA